ncbi:hypothetical protein AWB66_06306 [Caballeronia telluris]|uniref:Uncharacterized protein n=1 Tax=Caballeronia telluris TaxID=326475 RepID=A0A158KIY7_9BURK|nr:hypothetical protein AWB66_06306 [Caballeronia telluris]
MTAHDDAKALVQESTKMLLITLLAVNRLVLVLLPYADGPMRFACLSGPRVKTDGPNSGRSDSTALQTLPLSSQRI